MQSTNITFATKRIKNDKIKTETGGKVSGNKRPIIMDWTKTAIWPVRSLRSKYITKTVHIPPKEEAKITLQEDEKEESKDKKEQKEENKDALEKVQSKQEIDVNKRINERYTLGDILGIERGSKLIAVYSDAIENNENSTRFSFIIKKPDGSLEKAKMLEQVGGKQSDKNIYDINYDGSEVTKKSVQSSYKIDSSLAKNALITARIGQAGYIEVNYGEMDRTSHRDALTQQSETEHTFKTREQVREELTRGIENASTKEKATFINKLVGIYNKHFSSSMKALRSDGPTKELYVSPPLTRAEAKQIITACRINSPVL